MGYYTSIGSAVGKKEASIHKLFVVVTKAMKWRRFFIFQLNLRLFVAPGNAWISLNGAPHTVKIHLLHLAVVCRVAVVKTT